MIVGCWDSGPRQQNKTQNHPRKTVEKTEKHLTAGKRIAKKNNDTKRA